jgi:site-specific DNA-methyltransferase (adenine-specific)
MNLELDSIHFGDCLAWLKTLPSACVDAVITDPPYSSGGQFRGDRMADTNSKYVQSDTKRQYIEFSGDNRDQRSFGYWCTLWLSEALRVTKPGGVICCFSDWRQLPIVTDVVQAGGWVWRGIWVWDKTEGVRPQLGRFRSQCEYVAWGSNGSMPPSAEIGVLPGVYRAVVKAKDKLYSTGKPLDVMTELLRIVPPEGIVLDPFAGSGTTLLAAKLSGRRYLGCELSPEYHRIATERLLQSFMRTQFGEMNGELFTRAE